MTTPTPSKPSPNFPLFAHQNGQWAKKIGGKLKYFGPVDDPQAALARYLGTDQPIFKIPRKAKPDKPYEGFPLFAHGSGQWAKKISGKLYYFGPWHDADAALKRYLEERDSIKAGRVRRQPEGLTVLELVNRFLTSKKRRVDSGELTQRMWDDYDRTCKRVMEVLGKETTVVSLRPENFEKLRASFAKTHGPVRLTNDITWARVLFNFAFENDLIDRPVKYGELFDRPSRMILRRERRKRGKKMFQAAEIRLMLESAPAQLKAMILLAVNCGFGNADCARLTQEYLDLDGGWVNFHRPKTEIDRRCPLWPETVKAIREVLKDRPQPKDKEHGSRVFITKFGANWEPKSKTDCPISKEMAKLLDELEIKRPSGVSFRALRHVCQTIGEKSRDKDAVRAIMGHGTAANDMSAVYNEEGPDDERLLAVTTFVREWLYR